MSRSCRPVAFAILALAASAVLPACRARGTRALQPATDSLARDSIPRFIDVEVENHNWSDVVIYVLHGGTRTRLGTAGTAKSTEFRFPASYVFADRVSLLATPIGSTSRYQSERFKVSPGQRVVLTLESSISRSSLMIR
jgi:hypothetical protein